MRDYFNNWFCLITKTEIFLMVSMTVLLLLGFIKLAEYFEYALTFIRGS